MRSSDGQASVELVGTAWALLLSALVGFQLLAVGYGWAMAVGSVFFVWNESRKYGI